MHDARIIANTVLDRADEHGRAITNLDLQKIVYFLHGHYLRRFGRPLVEAEFEAWPYGPVHKTLYDAFKQFNDSPVEGRASAFDPVRRERRTLPTLAEADAISIIDEFLDYYLDMPTYLLVEFTHQPGTPWHDTVERANARPNVGMKITNAVIAERFEGPAPERSA